MVSSSPQIHVLKSQSDGETVEAVSDFIFLGSKITADGDCSHEIRNISNYLILIELNSWCCLYTKTKEINV